MQQYRIYLPHMKNSNFPWFARSKDSASSHVLALLVISFLHPHPIQMLQQQVCDCLLPTKPRSRGSAQYIHRLYLVFTWTAERIQRVIKWEKQRCSLKLFHFCLTMLFRHALDSAWEWQVSTPFTRENRGISASHFTLLMHKITHNLDDILALNGSC